jgi:hypothetical protein
LSPRPASHAGERARLRRVGCALRRLRGHDGGRTEHQRHGQDRRANRPRTAWELAARTVPSTCHYRACATVCWPSPCRGTTHRPATRSRIVGTPAQCPMVSARHSVPLSERQCGSDICQPQRPEMMGESIAQPSIGGPLVSIRAAQRGLPTGASATQPQRCRSCLS